MRIEGDYIVFTTAETSKLPNRCKGDQWTFTNTSNIQWGDVSGIHGGYENASSSQYQIRRLIAQCTPEQREMAGYNTESIHFL